MFYIKYIIQNSKIMFPWTNLETNIMPIQSYGTQIYSHLDPMASYMQLANYYYFPQQSYFQPNIIINQFQSSTLQPSNISGSFKPFRTEQILKIDQTKIDKFCSSFSDDEKIPNFSNQSTKTKNIHKNQRQLLRLKTHHHEKLKKQKYTIKYNEELYSAEDQINKRKSEQQEHLHLKYRRKNTESNIVNRIYSFLTTEFKNKKEVIRLGITDRKKQTYLKYLLLVVEAWKGPVKRQLLLNLMKPDQSLPAYRLVQKLYESDGSLSLEEFGYLNRVLIRMYLNKIAGISVITSKKMKKGVWKQHLQKIRELINYFFQSQQTSE